MCSLLFVLLFLKWFRHVLARTVIILLHDARGHGGTALCLSVHYYAFGRDFFQDRKSQYFYRVEKRLLTNTIITFLSCFIKRIVSVIISGTFQVQKKWDNGLRQQQWLSPKFLLHQKNRFRSVLSMIYCYKSVFRLHLS